MAGWRRTLAIGLLAVVAACGSGGSDGGAEDSSTTTTTTSSDEPTTEPTLEPTDPETTQSSREKPSVKIANAPIGGNSPSGGTQQCADVNWLGKKPIPDGTTIKLGSIHLEPNDIFELDQGSCPGDARSCTDLEWQGSETQACFVGAKQVAPADPGRSVLVILAVTVTCERQADCDSVKSNTDGSSVGFQPDPDFGTPSESPSESPSETPSDG
jgi:hypothetical protein